MLGAVDQTYLHAILRALAARNGSELMAEADRMGSRSLSFEMALQDLATLLHRLALVQIVPDTVDADDPDAATIRELAARPRRASGALTAPGGGARLALL